MMPSHLTRREIYNLIWEEPFDGVAAKLGVNEWLLRNLCERHRVPIPTPAYWRAKLAGKKAKLAVFVDTKNPAF
jgi:hypothetical protein